LPSRIDAHTQLPDKRFKPTDSLGQAQWWLAVLAACVNASGRTSLPRGSAYLVALAREDENETCVVAQLARMARQRRRFFCHRLKGRVVRKFRLSRDERIQYAAQKAEL